MGDPFNDSQHNAFPPLPFSTPERGVRHRHNEEQDDDGEASLLMRMCPDDFPTPVVLGCVHDQQRQAAAAAAATPGGRVLRKLGGAPSPLPSSPQPSPVSFPALSPVTPFAMDGLSPIAPHASHDQAPGTLSPAPCKPRALRFDEHE